jgi:hypothetical protein
VAVADYYVADVDFYERRLREIFDDLVVTRGDFGFRLSVTRPGLDFAMNVYDPATSLDGPLIDFNEAVKKLMPSAKN